MSNAPGSPRCGPCADKVPAEPVAGQKVLQHQAPQGLIVQREDAGLADQRSGFDSRSVHRRMPTSVRCKGHPHFGREVVAHMGW